MSPRAVLFGLWLVSSWAGSLSAQSNVRPDSAWSWSGNIGWVQWQPDSQIGAVVGEYHCSGFLYSPNVGWIHLGDGAPDNGFAYSNQTAGDYGVNHLGGGLLRGSAYAANVGWIQFESMGDPRLDLRSGRLSGAIFGANIGWIALEGDGFELAVDSLASGGDSDSDGLPDAWEYLKAGGVRDLSAAKDFDGDGSTDLGEWLADTDPTDPASQLRITNFKISSDASASTLTWTSRPSRVYWLETRESVDGPTSIFGPFTFESEVGQAKLYPTDPARIFRVFSSRFLSNP